MNYEKLWIILPSKINELIKELNVIRGSKKYKFVVKHFIESHRHEFTCKIGAYVSLKNGGQIPVHDKNDLLASFSIINIHNTIDFTGQYILEPNSDESILGQLKTCLITQLNVCKDVVAIENNIKLSGRSPFSGRRFDSGLILKSFKVKEIYPVFTSLDIILEKIFSIIAPSFYAYFNEISNREYLKLI